MSKLIKLAAAFTLLAAGIDARVLNLARGNLTAEAFLANPTEVTYEDDSTSGTEEKRDCIQQPRQYFQLVGDGDPHQNYIITQVAGTQITCPGTVSKSFSHSTSWSIGGGVNFGTKDFEFGNLGFSVGEEDTDEIQWQVDCTDVADHPDAMCLLRYTAVTAVTVDFYSGPYCGLPRAKLGRGVVYLPNADNKGSTWARGLSYGGSKNMIQCRGDADRVIPFYCGPKGGPEYWDKPGVVPGPGYANYLQNASPAKCQPPIEALRLGY